MDIKEVMALKRKLSLDIQELICSFESKTEVYITHAVINRVSTASLLPGSEDSSIVSHISLTTNFEPMPEEGEGVLGNSWEPEEYKKVAYICPHCKRKREFEKDDAKPVCDNCHYEMILLSKYILEG